MKKIIFVLIILIIPSVSFATSGACSSHGGVNCSAGANYAGKVQCNDGWVNSSVYFSDTEECKTNSGCGEYEKPEYDMLTKMWSDFINKAEKDTKQRCDNYLNQLTDLDKQFDKACTDLIQSTRNFLTMGGVSDVDNDPSLKLRIKECEREKENRIAENQNKYNLCMGQNTGYDNPVVKAKLRLACITLKPQITDTSCQSQLGTDSSSKNGSCVCDSGYTLSGLSKKCVPVLQMCQENNGVNSYYKDGQCFCSDGYLFDKKAVQCVPEKQIRDASCQSQAGVNSYSQGEDCYCSDGYTYDVNTKQCAVALVPESKKPVADLIKPKLKSSTIVSTKITKEPIKTTETITPPQTQNTTPINQAPVKKLTWWQKIFSWFK